MKQALRTMLVATVVMAAGATSAQANVWLSDGGSPLNTRYSSRGPIASKGILPTRMWDDVFDLRMGAASGTPIIGPNGLVYVGTTGGYVVAYVRDSGIRLWSQYLGGLTASSAASIYNSLLYTDTGGLYAAVSTARGTHLVGMDPITGAQTSRVVVDGQRNTEAFASPAYSAEHGLIYVAVCACKAEEERKTTYARGTVTAVDENTKEIAWRTTTSVRPGGSVAGTPLVFDALDRVYVTTGHSRYDRPDPYTSAILALDSTTGAIVGRFQAHDDDGTTNQGVDPRDRQGFIAPAHASNGPQGIAIGAGARDGTYYAVDPDTMELLYATQVGAPTPLGGVRGASATDGRGIFGLSALPGLVYGLESRTGERRFLVPAEDPVSYGDVSAGSKVIWWADSAGFLNAADPSLGRPYGRAALPLPSTGGIALGYGRLFVSLGTQEGTPGGIVAFK